MENFISRNGQTIKKGQRVAVHFNAHNNYYSVLEMKSENTIGKVIGYADCITLENVTCKVDKTKKKKALEKGTKDRHTFLVGTVKHLDKYDNYAKLNFQSATYSPKIADYFFDLDEYLKSDFVDLILKSKKMYLTRYAKQNGKTIPVIFYDRYNSEMLRCFEGEIHI